MKLELLQNRNYNLPNRTSGLESYIGRQMKPGDGENVVEKWAHLLPASEDWISWLPKLLDQGMEEGLFHGGVVENYGDKKRIVAFGLSTYLPDGIVADFFNNPAPYLNARLISRYYRGDTSVFLGEAKQAEFNRSEGMNMMVLEYYSECHDFSKLQASAIAQTILPQYLQSHAGFNIKMNIHETEEIFGYMQLAGGQQELAHFEAQNPYSLREGGLGPRVVYGLHRKANSSFLSPVLPEMIMNYHHPKLSLVPREQKTILAAMDGLTDQEIAVKYGISHDAIKQRWKCIYRQIESVDPNFFANPTLALGQETRGREKRRVVIASLANTLQELRPYCLRRGR